MSRDLRLLVVEDSETDANLVVRELQRGGYEVTFERVETASAMRAAMKHDAWDLIISDCGMPSFNALTALSIARTGGSDVPFIVLSGTLDEDDAVEVLRAGANDFLTKQRMVRLLPAVERELRERAIREEGRQSQQRIKVTEERFRTLLESAPDGMVIVGSDGRIAFVNNQTETLFGYTHEELVGQRIEVLVPQRLRASLEAKRASFFDAEGSLSTGEGLDLMALRKNGSEFPVEIRLSPARTAEGDLVTAAIRDVTARKEAERALRDTEAQLRHAQKMEAVGTLAGGVAHDFNNVLSVILSYTGFLKDALDPADPMRVDVDEIGKAAERAASLTRQLLAFSRKQAFVPRVIDPNEVVRGLDPMLRRLVASDVEITMVPGAGVGAIVADKGQLEQLVMNLVVNARDATPKGGRVRVETASAVVHDAETAPCPGMPPGEYVVIEVKDTGSGMTPEARARIFEPFFTTKELGKGTGLGLSVVYGIVAQSGGFISVDTAPGKGSTFRVYFPRTSKTPKEPSDPPPSSRTGGTETILLVEDDAQVRVAVATTLRRAGYHVLESANAGEALLASEQCATRIDLMVTDVLMPRMSGHELAARLSGTRPEMRVLYMSGHVPDAILERADVSSSIIEKPMKAGALLGKVREIIDRT